MIRALLIGDVGGPASYHVGDEAMLSANLDGLRKAFAADLEATVVSADPDWTAAHHGVRAVPRLGFPADGDRDLIARAVANAESAVPTMPAIAALAASDVLLVSGGGNLNSTWRNHLHERVALIGAAAALGKPVLVLGQTLGPRLLDDDRLLLADALSAVHLVGVRELDSLRVALRLGVPLHRLLYQLDDAAFLADAPTPEVELPDEPWIAVTLTGPAERVAPGWAPALAALHRRTGGRLVFVPHAALPDDDAGLGDALAARLGGALLPLPLLNDRQVAGVTRRAAMVVSSRYHPLVFAAAGGVPGLALFSDDYTRVKLRGVLAHAGLESWSLDHRFLDTPLFVEAAAELWVRREEIAAHLADRRPGWQARFRNHWTAIRRRIADPEAEAEAELEPVPRPASDPPQPRGWWSTISAAGAADAETALWRELALAEQRETAERYARSLRDVLSAREEELVNLKALMEELRSDAGSTSTPAEGGDAETSESERADLPP